MGDIAKMVYGRRLKESYVGSRATEMKVQGRMKRGRPETRWSDRVRDDIKQKGLSADEVYDLATWRRISPNIGHT